MFRLTIIFIALFGIALIPSAQQEPSQDINIHGVVTDENGKAISGATVVLQSAGLEAATSSDGRFALVFEKPIQISPNNPISPRNLSVAVQNGQLSIVSTVKSDVSVTIFSLQGTRLFSFRKQLNVGIRRFALPRFETGIYFCKIVVGSNTEIIKTYAVGSLLHAVDEPYQGVSVTHLAKQSASDGFSDVLKVTKAGFLDYSMEITAAEIGSIEIKLKEAAEFEKFSFFVTSLQSLQELSGSKDGFGGDLRFGETGPGAGLRGADKICETIAEQSMPGSAAKQWRAFLSVSADENGEQVDAKDRIGAGPWYDRLGRLLAPNLNDLLNPRPENGDATIKNDLPNEWGVPNHDPEGTGDVDNHHMITGTDLDGTLYSIDATCKDWTSAGKDATARYGFAWIRKMGPRFKTAATNPWDEDIEMPFGDGEHWFSGSTTKGCEPGIEIIETGPGDPSATFIGSGGGYGGWYCFALIP